MIGGRQSARLATYTSWVPLDRLTVFTEAHSSQMQGSSRWQGGILYFHLYMELRQEEEWQCMHGLVHPHESMHGKLELVHPQHSMHNKLLVTGKLVHEQGSLLELVYQQCCKFTFVRSTGPQLATSWRPGGLPLTGQWPSIVNPVPFPRRQLDCCFLIVTAKVPCLYQCLNYTVFTIHTK